MADIIGTMMKVKSLDELSRQKNFINSVHPLVKLLVTLTYITVLASFNRYEIAGLLPFFLYPVIVILACDLPVIKLVKRVLLVEPFIVITGILNPIFDKNLVQLGGMEFSGGWLTFASLMLKSTLMVLAGLLLIATTGIDEIARALSILKIPSIFILLFILTYRYIFVLMDEAGRLIRAYSLRAPGQAGVNIRVWGSMVGQLLIRTYNRAQTIYQSMTLKGYSGNYTISVEKRFRSVDAVYMVLWLLFIITARVVNIPLFIAGLMA